MNHKTLLAVFPQHNEDYAKLVGKMRSKRSYLKYQIVYKHLSEFIKQRYKTEDIALKELTPAFITDFEVFLHIEKGHCNNTIWSYMMPFRSIIFMVINNGRLSRDPFYAYHITKEETKRGFLTIEEITKMINGKFTKKKYELVRDLFIFCCFTGLSWTDMNNLTKDNIQTSFDGHVWIKTARQKTGVESNIRLLDVAKHIIEKYDGLAKEWTYPTFRVIISIIISHIILIAKNNARRCDGQRSKLHRPTHVRAFAIAPTCVFLSIY